MQKKHRFGPSIIAAIIGAIAVVSLLIIPFTGSAYLQYQLPGQAQQGTVLGATIANVQTVGSMVLTNLTGPSASVFHIDDSWIFKITGQKPGTSVWYSNQITGNPSVGYISTPWVQAGTIQADGTFTLNGSIPNDSSCQRVLGNWGESWGVGNTPSTLSWSNTLNFTVVSGATATTPVSAANNQISGSVVFTNLSRNDATNLIPGDLINVRITGANPNAHVFINGAWIDAACGFAQTDANGVFTWDFPITANTPSSLTSSPGSHTLKFGVDVANSATNNTGNSNPSAVPLAGTINYNVTATSATSNGTTPTVWIDSPAPNATVSGNVSVSGWSINNINQIGSSAISSVQVLVDGSVAGTATYGVSRPDVCTATGGVYPGRVGCPNVGYSFSWNSASVANGTHTIQVVAASSDNPPVTGSASVTVTVNNNSGPACTQPTTGTITAPSSVPAGSQFQISCNFNLPSAYVNVPGCTWTSNNGATSTFNCTAGAAGSQKTYSCTPANYSSSYTNWCTLPASVSSTVTFSAASQPSPPLVTTGFAPAILPNATLYLPYSQQLTAIGAGTNPVWSIAQTTTSALPAGLSISPSGLISGTPTSYGNYTFTATVSSSSGTIQQQMTLAVNSVQQTGTAPVINNISINSQNGTMVISGSGFNPAATTVKLFNASYGPSNGFYSANSSRGGVNTTAPVISSLSSATQLVVALGSSVGTGTEEVQVFSPGSAPASLANFENQAAEPVPSNMVITTIPTGLVYSAATTGPAVFSVTLSPLNTGIANSTTITVSGSGFSKYGLIPLQLTGSNGTYTLNSNGGAEANDSTMVFYLANAQGNVLVPAGTYQVSMLYNGVNIAPAGTSVTIPALASTTTTSTTSTTTPITTSTNPGNPLNITGNPLQININSQEGDSAKQTSDGSVYVGEGTGNAAAGSVSFSLSAPNTTGFNSQAGTLTVYAGSSGEIRASAIVAGTVDHNFSVVSSKPFVAAFADADSVIGRVLVMGLTAGTSVLTFHPTDLPSSNTSQDKQITVTVAAAPANATTGCPALPANSHWISQSYCIWGSNLLPNGFSQQYPGLTVASTGPTLVSVNPNVVSAPGGTPGSTTLTVSNLPAVSKNNINYWLYILYNNPDGTPYGSVAFPWYNINGNGNQISIGNNTLQINPLVPAGNYMMSVGVVTGTSGSYQIQLSNQLPLTIYPDPTTVLGQTTSYSYTGNDGTIYVGSFTAPAGTSYLTGVSPNSVFSQNTTLTISGANFNPVAADNMVTISSWPTSPTFTGPASLVTAGSNGTGMSLVVNVPGADLVAGANGVGLDLISVQNTQTGSNTANSAYLTVHQLVPQTSSSASTTVTQSSAPPTGTASTSLGTTNASSLPTMGSPFSAPSVWIDSPTANASVFGTVSVSGWAINNTARVGSAVGTVQLYVDGHLVSPATYGVSRSDVCAAFPGRIGCPSVGYNVSWDSTTVANGTHTIQIVAASTDSPPVYGSASVSVNVNNTATSAGSQTTAAAHPVGTFVSYNNVIYYVSSAGLIGVPSAAIFLSNGGQWQNIVPANAGDYALYTQNPNLPIMVANDPRVSGASSITPAVETDTLTSGNTTPALGGALSLNVSYIGSGIVVMTVTNAATNQNQLVSLNLNQSITLYSHTLTVTSISGSTATVTVQ